MNLAKDLLLFCSTSWTAVIVSQKHGEKCYEIHTYVLNFCEKMSFAEEWTFNSNSHRGLGWTEKIKALPL
jgi:hypothetical protein